MSFDISKIDTQDVVNANKMLRISTLRCLLTAFVLIRNIFSVSYENFSLSLSLIHLSIQA